MLLLSPWRIVPPKFFQTHCQVILGLSVLAALDLFRSGGDRAAVGASVLMAGSSYLAAVAWGLGRPAAGVPLAAATVLAAADLIARGSARASIGLMGLEFAGRLASAALLGSTLSAMLLGHHYLTAPAMSIEPLKRFVRCMAASLAVRGVLAAVGLMMWLGGAAGGATGSGGSALFLAMRWGMGIAGPALATTLAWKTVAIRSTQSATGILYIAMTLVLFGELTALVLSREMGCLF